MLSPVATISGHCTFVAPPILGKRETNTFDTMMKTIGTLFFTLMLAFTMQAQKFGHVNTAALLDLMPEVDKADQILQAFQEGLQKGGEAKAASLQADYNKYVEDMNNGVLSKMQQAERENALAKAQDDIDAYQKQVQLQVLQKREELLKPILEKIDEAIKAEGKEGGYTFIFDSSVSGLLYVPQGDDLLEAIKKRLGV